MQAELQLFQVYEVLLRTARATEIKFDSSLIWKKLAFSFSQFHEAAKAAK